MKAKLSLMTTTGLRGSTTRRSLAAVIAAVSLASFALAASVLAEPLVVMEAGKPTPGVVTGWSSSGKRVTLTVRAGSDAEAVAKLISDETGTKAKATGDKILVIGKTEEELLSALADLEFLTDLGGLADASFAGRFDSGSSLRAKKTADMAKLMKDLSRSATGRVANLRYANFPEVEVEVRVLRAPTGELAKGVRKGAVVRFRPVLKKKGAETDWSDEHTQQNAGAWYLEKNDSVEIRIGQSVDGAFEAELLTR